MLLIFIIVDSFFFVDDEEMRGIMSNRQKGVLKGLATVWSWSVTRYRECHIIANLWCKYLGCMIRNFTNMYNELYILCSVYRLSYII